MGDGPVAGAAVRLDRVMAVLATLSSGQVQLGSGFLLDDSTVLTAEHCTRDTAGRHDVRRLRVIRASDGAAATVVDQVTSPGPDVAVLEVEPDDPATWSIGELAPVVFARVDRTRSGELRDCEAVGYPLFQRDPRAERRSPAELRGTIRRLDQADTGRLVIRDPLIDVGTAALDSIPRADDQESPWGGLSGALVFHHGRAIGVIVEHHPRQGANAVQAIGFDTLVRSPDATRVTARIGLHDIDDLEWAAADTTTETRIADRVWSPHIPVVGRWFTGRAETLARLAEGADRPTRARTVVTQAVAGMGGVGKTTVAAAYAEALRDRTDIVWWVRAETAATLVTDLADLAARVGVDAAGGDVTTDAEAVLRWLETTDRPWLVVYDNVIDEASVVDWLPRQGIGQVVITSRNQNLDALGHVIDIDVFDDDTAARFLHNRAIERDPDAAADTEAIAEIVERLQGLPLALEQAARWVTRSPQRTYRHFAALFDDATRQAFPGLTRPPDRDSTAQTTWKVSLDAAAGEAPAAEPVLAVLGHLAPDPLPVTWLTDLTDDPYLLTTTDGITDALDALYGYSLVNLTPDAVTVHRIVQYATRRTAPPDAAGAAIRLLRRQSPEDPGDPTSWPTIALLAPHALRAAHSTRSALPDLATDLWWVLDDIGAYQRASGNFTAAIDTLREAEHIADTHFHDGDPNRFTARNNLALAYQAAGRHDNAITLLEDSLPDTERILGPDHPNSLQGRINLALADYSAGRYDDAITLLEATLPDTERILGPDHPQALVARNNLALAYHAAGRYDDAITLFEATVVESELMFGHDRPETLQSRNNLAGAYQAAGRHDDAITLFEATLPDTERILGRDHPQTLTSRNNLAESYRQAGRYDDAITLHEITRAGRERILGPDHPETLQSRNNLALAYQAAGRHDDAITLFEATLPDTEHILGPDHPQTLTSRNNLAESYRQAGRHDDAITLLETTLPDTEHILGPDHPQTLASRNNLALAYDAVGRHDDAITLFETTLPDTERILGPDHPNSILARNNLAGAYQAIGRHDDAITLLETTLPDTERILGPDHPNSLQGRNNLALAYWETGRREEAVEMMSRAATIATETLSPDHEATRQLTANVDAMRDALED